MAHLGSMDHRMVRNGPKYRKIERQEVKTGSVAVDQFSVAKEPYETTFKWDFHFIDFNNENGKKLYPLLQRSIDVESCRTDVEDLNQLIIRRGRRINQILRNDATRKKARHVINLAPIISRNLQWSPLGSYLLAMDKRTILLYGGTFGIFPLIMRCRHTMVERVDFSPSEKYLVGYSRPEPSNTKELWLKIFDVRTGRLMVGVDGHVAQASWPVIRWAGGKDDKYFATLIKNTVSVYETETFGLLGNKPVDVDDVLDISWSPTGSILAVLKGGQFTEIVLVQIPNKVELMHKDIIINPIDCKMYWQSNGKYLAVKVDRHTYSVFELFRFKEDGITITTEVLEVDKKTIAFAWEPSGHRFAVIHGDQSKSDVSFYSMETLPNPLATFEDKQADTLFWSPRGKHIVLADLNGGCLEFFDVDKLETMNTAPHPMITDIAWDPTGRYVATAVTISEEISEESETPEIDCFKMWSFNGDLLYTVPTEDYRLLQMEWRPYGGIIDHEMLENLEESDVESENSSSEEEDG